MEKSYMEIKVSFMHIVVLLGGIIVIGAFLFFLGFQAGKSSVRNELQAATESQTAQNSDLIKLPADTTKTGSKESTSQRDTSITDEIQLHQLPTTSNPETTTTDSNVDSKKDQSRPIEAKPLTKEPYWAVQVGAFSDYSNAQKYSTQFAKMGYPTEINRSERGNTKLFRVWVGNFKTKAEAQREREKLQKLEKKEFKVVASE